MSNFGLVEGLEASLLSLRDRFALVLLGELPVINNLITQFQTAGNSRAAADERKPRMIQLVKALGHTFPQL